MSMIETPLTDALTSFLDVEVARTKLVSTNLANIDTPNYRARDLDFHAELKRASAWEAGQGEGAMLPASYAPVSHRIGGLMQRPDGNDVSVERESLLLAESQMKFNFGVQLLKDQFHLISLAINSGGTSS